MKTPASLSRQGGAGNPTPDLKLTVQAIVGGRRIALVGMD